MESPREQNPLTTQQIDAVKARGNVLVMAGAGTGKTHTLVARCLDLICEEKVSLDEILIVTFTEAAATEMKQRLRAALENKSQENPDDSHGAEQLALFDAAHIGTLHGFCFKFVREHFHELGLDPQISILDEGQTRLLADETLDEQFNSHYENEDAFSLAVQDLIKIYGSGRDERIRALVLRLHHYSQTRPDAENWLARQIKSFSVAEPVQWRKWFSAVVSNWRDESLHMLENLRAENLKAAECLEILNKFKPPELLAKILAVDGKENFPKGKFTKLREPLEDFFDGANFLNSLTATKENEPLAEDWGWVRVHMKALLQLAQEFSEKFSALKRDDGVLDFHDLEQFALKLLWDSEAEKPTEIAERWREKLRFVFVDEYQDINAAQDKVISALSREGSNANRFLVGDVKQSIYRFRLADPKIFRDYVQDWHGKNGRTIPLTENFRSRESLLNFVNSVFEPLMREETGGVNYDAEAKLKFGEREKREGFSTAKDSSPRAELILRIKSGRNDEVNPENESGADELADLEESEKEARMLASHLQQLKDSGRKIWDDETKESRAVEWRDMAILLRAPSGKAEIFAKQFDRAGIPLVVERGGFYDSSEILDLLGVLQLLDNPLQDVPLIAILRSPLVGCSLDELAEIRLTASGHFWFALNQVQNPKSKVQNKTRAMIKKFLERFHRWRKLAQQSSLSQCLESILAETHYDDWLKSCPRGSQRHANVQRFLNLAEKFDQFQRQGLFRFLKFIVAQREAEVEPEVSPVAEENAVRLMSIHQSKGLEFPVVAVADFAKNFNTQDLRGEIIFDEEFGLCPKVQPPSAKGRYPSLPHWLAQKHQRREQAGEELRLLYVAMTRARDHLVLTGSVTANQWENLWNKSGAITPQKILAAKSYADWLGLWFAQQNGASSAAQGEWSHLHWRIAENAELAGGTAAEKSESKVELPELDYEAKRKLHETFTWDYRFEAAKTRKAKQSVTTLSRTVTDELDEESAPIFAERKFARLLERNARGKISAAAAGTAHHKFLQYFSLESAASLESLAAEAERLEQEKVLSAEEQASLILENIAAFWNSVPGQKIRRQPSEFVKRELAFTAKFRIAELDDILGEISGANLEKEFVVVQGMVDLAVLTLKEIWLVDFKTDNLNEGDFSKKEQDYKKQLKLYASALAKIYSRPVTNCWLHFLSAQKTADVKIDPGG